MEVMSSRVARSSLAIGPSRLIKSSTAARPEGDLGVDSECSRMAGITKGEACKIQAPGLIVLKRQCFRKGTRHVYCQRHRVDGTPGSGSQARAQGGQAGASDRE